MTKTKKIAMFAIPMLAVLMIGSAVAPAFAGAPPPGPAVVGMGTSGCTLLDGDGNFIQSDTLQSVATNNGKGTGKLTCKAFDVANTSGAAVHFDFDNTGLLCNGSENWKIVVSQNDDGTTGDATMQCRFR